MTAPPDNVTLLLSISRDARFVETARNVTERVAFHVGRPEQEAREIGAAIEAVVGQIVEQMPARAGGDEIALQFNASAERLEIEIAYAGKPGGRLEQSLGRDQSGGRDLHRAMSRVEFGHAQGRDVCRLTRNFPDFT